VTAPCRIVIADDHPPTRAAVRAALEGNGFEVCAAVGDADTAVEAARRARPDVCLLDVNMPGGGIRAAGHITAHVPDTTVVMFTVSTTDADLFDALRAGASGYLLKDTDAARLPLALLDVLAGNAALPRNLVMRLVEEFRERGRRKRLSLRGQRGVDLTSREWDVLDLMRQGLRTAEMAERLYVSPVTVRTHVSSILKKLRVPDRAAAVRLLQER